MNHESQIESNSPIRMKAVTVAWWCCTAFWILLAVTAYVPLLPVDWWWVRIGDFPRVQLLVAYLFGLLPAVFFRRRAAAKFWLGVLVGAVVIQSYWIFPYLPFAPHEVEWAKQDDSQLRLRILTANVFMENESRSQLLKTIERESPDLIVLCEVNQRWMNDLADLKSQYPFVVARPMENTYGIALFSRLPIVESRIRHMVSEEIPSIDARVRMRSGHVVRLFAVHPNPPRPNEDTTKRDAELILVGREMEKVTSGIVLGDLNDVGWSRTTNLFQEISGLLDPRKGRGLYPTYDASSLVWRYPLDYLFHSDDFRVAELKTLGDIGSDHFPLLVELSYEPDASATQEGPHLDAGDREDAQDAVDAVKSRKKPSSR